MAHDAEPTPPDLRVAISADGGRTFSYPTIAVSSSGVGVVWGFPALAEACDHVLHAAWVTPLESGLQDVVVASSSDGGATWGAPVSWSGPDTLTAGPGIAAGDGVLNVAWYRVTAPGQSSSLIFARGRPDGSSVERTVVVDGIVARPSTPAPRNEANTDFAAFALLPDGRAAIVWSDNGVWLSVENATSPARGKQNNSQVGASASPDHEWANDEARQSP